MIYKNFEIEAQKFQRGWTSVVYWCKDLQSIATVGAATEDAALEKARELVDTTI